MTTQTSPVLSEAAPAGPPLAGRSVKPAKKPVLKRLRESWWIYLFLLPTILGYGAYTVYPLVASWWYAFLDWPGFAARGEFIGLANFQLLWEDDLFWNSFGNSLIFLVLAVPLRVGLALLLAIVLNRPSTPARGLFRTLLFLPVVTTGAIIGVVFTLILDANGPVNAALVWSGLVDSPINFLGHAGTSLYSAIGVWVWKWLGITLIYWLAALQTVPAELYEAARIDGAGSWAEFRFITLPMLRPFLVIITLIDMVGALNVFDLVMTLTAGGPAFSSEVVELYIYRTAFGATVPQLGYASAAAVLFGLLTMGLAVAQALGIRAVRKGM